MNMMSDGDHQTTGGSHVLDDDDLLQEILLRVPPHPSSLPRALLVCKRWQRVVSDPWFLRCFRCHHRKPPLLGFYKQPCGQDDMVLFHPILDPPDRVPPQRFSLERAIAAVSIGPDRGIFILGCRHGRVAFMSMSHEDFILFVYDPVARGYARLPAPPELFFTLFISGAAVLCAADEPDHVHGACHSSPFMLVLASTMLGEEDGDGRSRRCPVACVYSSETGTWGSIIWHDPCRIDEFTGSNVLIGHALYWLVSFMGNYDDDGNYMSEPDGIVEFDLDRQSLAVIKPPLPVRKTIRHPQIIKTVDGGIGLVTLSNMTLVMWHRTKVNRHDVAATWVLFKRVDLNSILGPQERPVRWRRRQDIFGYDEDANVIFICIDSSLFMVQLESMRFRRHYERIEREYYTPVYHPFSSFCTTI
ncbi:hypothetical protein BS78_05G217400 [Paspalum vaginatum]|nr:hypothetical protein BS78_05G217400 [Paspalum vaginatum]